MGRYWNRVRLALKSKASGFTIVEVLVVAPITILAIGALIVMIVALTGDVLKTRGSNTMTFEVQDALSRIEQDIKQSGGFLAASNINPLMSPQGYDNATAPFTNVGTNGNMLILNAYATKDNPATNPAAIVFNKNQPNTCGDSENENFPLMINIVYFVKDESLWRRTIMPEQYLTMGCSAPWQQPSCAPGITGTMCQANDVRLVDGIAETNDSFNIEYYESTESTTPLNAAVDQEASAGDRQQALSQATVARISIKSARTFAGNEVTRSGEVIGISKNNNLLESLGRTAPVIQEHPSEQSVAKGTNVTLTASATGSDLSVQWQLSQDQGANWYPVSGATSPSLTLNNVGVDMDGNRYRAVFYNDFASSVTEPAALYVYDTSWNTLTLQNSWADYGSSYSTAKYRKTSDGVVVLQGLITRGSAPATDSIIANLPVGYRPSDRLIFLNSSSSTTHGRVDIDNDGNIRFYGGGSSWYSLDNISFTTDNGQYERTEVTTWANGWDNYEQIHGGAGWERVSYTVGPNNRVHLQGLAGGSVFTSGTHMFVLPEALRPTTHLFTIGRSGSNTWLEYGIASDSVKTQGTGSSYASVNNIFYPASYTGWNDLGGGSWVYWGTYSTPRYTRGPDGLVTLTGILKGGSYVYDSGIIGVLPAGYRPDSRLLIYAVGNNAFLRIDIDTTGSIKFMGTQTSGWVSLDGISFFAD